MLRSYIVVALRRLRRERTYAGINILGLAIGLAACLVIGTYVSHELSYDRFHSKADRIYRVRMVMEKSDPPVWPSTPVPVAPLLQAEFPEVEQVVRVNDVENPLVESRLLRAREERFLYAEPSIFDVFDFRVLSGNARAGLTRPYSVALTPATARRYFGNQNPIGKTLRLNNEQTYEVVAVVAPAPANSHLQFDFLASFASQFNSRRNDTDWFRTTFTYALLRDGHTTDQLNSKLTTFSKKYVHPPFRGQGEITLLPLTDIHLYGGEDIQPQGDIRYVYLFSAVGLLILLIACINYMNLATARSARRAREVGVRKVTGARRRQLLLQFLGESFVFVLIALPVALILAHIFMPAFGELVGRSLEIRLSPGLAVTLATVTVTVSIISGSYPAFVLSSYQAATVLKGNAAGRGARSLRKGLVVLQFTASVVLIVCAAVIHQQLQYVQAARLGFDHEQVLVIETHDELKENSIAFKQELLRHPAVERVSLVHALPSRPFAITGVGHVDAFTLTDPSQGIINSNWVDSDFIETLGLTLLAGRNFSPAFPSDVDKAILINETLQRHFGWKDAIGKQIDQWTVVGVLQDFHIGSLRERITPTMLFYSPDASTRAVVKLRPGDLRQTLASLRKTWTTFVPSVPFEYTFLDDDFAAMYRAEERLGRLFLGFAVLAIFVSCLGVFGLAAFTVESRTKEIGVRKVLGASISNIVGLLSREFALLVTVAFLFALPVAYYAMSRWLEGFAYRVELGAGTFLFAGTVALAIALVTAGYQALRAALSDPVKSLRYE